MSLLKKVILVGLLTVFSTSLWANSCPNLTGKFLCQDDKSQEEKLVDVSQNTTDDGVTSYLITDANSGEKKYRKNKSPFLLNV